MSEMLSSTRRANVRAISKTPRRPFGAITRDLLIERGFTTGIGNPNWSGFSHTLDGIQYESLRKAVTGERHPSPKIMEAVAESLGISPSIFWEYELWLVQRAFDPSEVGEEEALANLERWSKKGGGR